MRSTGNDIVCLGLIDKERTNNRRFYTRILAPSEEALSRQPGLADLPFELFVWLCWSVKESAFKYLQRTLPTLVFSPVNIVVSNIIAPSVRHNAQNGDVNWEGDANSPENYSGEFSAMGETFYFRSKINFTTIATVVSNDETFSGVAWGIRNISGTDASQQSEQVRRFVLKRLQTFFPGKKLAIEKTPEGYPVITEGNEALALPLSFAHHGRTVSYSLQFAS